ncbi:MAG: prepilin-type N-terminal cleavage/methylation domain-containing protein [Deltaproteobacteria bacterium]|nr:prepilin-type N-terminal cleavage/methylation domain-containing protein [Deltaproteobacteria bacterium]
MTDDNKGFTLIELAIVLVIVGILIGVGSGMVGMLITAIKVRESRDHLDAAMQSVTSWASANNRLPDTTSNPSTNPALFANAAKTPNDAWGQGFIYLYDNALAPATATKDTICGRRSTVISLTDSNTGATISNVAYLALSQADNAITDTKIGGAAVTSGPLSTTAGMPITADTFNDIVRWVTLDELRTKIGCQGAPLKIVNNELPFGAAPNPYSAILSADGGVPISGSVIGTQTGNYTWCVEFVSTPKPGAALVFDTNPTGGIKAAGACWSSSETAGNFVQGTTLTLQKKAGFGNFSTGSYQLTVFSRDGAASPATTAACNTNPGDNCVQKTFVLTMNPN